ncbi:MAG: sulfatase [Bryobacteraceae bacterium]
MSLTRRQFLTATGVATIGRAAAIRKPNVVFIVADDLGYGELGCMGNPEIPTPHIDSIARNGVRMTQSYVSAPVCCPSRAGFLTGRYQTRFGHEFNLIGPESLKPGVGLPLDETTMADCLKQAGYATGMVGKWHLGADSRHLPLQRGFDEFFGFLHEGHFFAPLPYRGMITRLRVNEPPYDDSNPILRGEDAVEEKEYLTDAFTREAVSFIDRHKDHPFFLYLPYNAIHSPMQAKVTDVRRFKHSIHDGQRRVFAGMLAPLDQGIGEILDRLRRHGLNEDTLVFFISDNGGPTAELTSSNKPLRGGKGQLFEGGIRVPFLVQWQGTIPPGRVIEHPVSAIDILPTAVAAAGAKLPPKALDGVNLLPLLAARTSQPPHETLFWRYGMNVALRKGDWKIVRQREPGKEDPAFQLFDLARDSPETQDLASKKPDLLQSLEAELRRINRQMVKPLWGQNRVWG